MSLNFVDSICTPPRKKRARYFGHNPNANLKIKTDLRTQREDISKCSVHDLECDADRLLFLTNSIGVGTVVKLYSVLKTIPDNFPNRLKYFFNISQYIRGLETMTESAITQIGVLLDKMDLPKCSIQQELWTASHKMKIPLVLFLAPKVDYCLVEGCNGKLYGSEKEVTNITLFSMNGPQPGVKCVLSCKECGARYGIEKYRPRGEGARYYPDDCRPSVVSSSNKVYLTEDLFEFMCESGNHGFVSSQAFSQIYVSVYHGEHAVTKQFCDWREATFGQAAPDDEAGASSDDSLTGGNNNEVKGCAVPNPFLSRKNAIEATFSGELEREIRKRNMIEDVSFKNESCREKIMKTVDELRRSELYPHPPENCNQDCRRKGCQKLRVIDSCWKLCIPHCMLAVETEVEGFPLLNFPNVCTEEPKPGSVFCPEHHDLLKKHSIPTEKSEFLKHIGCKENPQSQDEIRKVDEKVISFMKTLASQDERARTVGTSATMYQGTESLVQQIPVEALNDNHHDEKCNKDTGEKGRLRQRARGHFAAVSGGGNIICFNPIYKSESPSQVFMLAIQMIYEEVRDIPEGQQEEFLQDYILSYDNMCNLDKLKAASYDLPLPD